MLPEGCYTYVCNCVGRSLEELCITGSVKKGEDEHDQAVEILDTIRWVSDEHPELRTMMGDLLHSYNKTSWESMNRYEPSLTL